MVDKNNKLKKVFAESLSIAIEKVVDELEYNTISEWDSIGHMSLIAAIEDEFDIMMETDDIIDMSTFKKAKEMFEENGDDVGDSSRINVNYGGRLNHS